MIGEQHREVMGQFFQANIAGRDSQQQGAGLAWLVEFWYKTDRQQSAEIGAWAEAQKAALQASADQHMAALDDLKQASNGNRAERRAAARKPSAAARKPRAAVKKAAAKP